MLGFNQIYVLFSWKNVDFSTKINKKNANFAIRA